MRDLLGVDVAQPIDNLLENLLGIWLLESPTFAYVIEQVTTGTQFHDYDDVLVSFYRLVDLHHVVVAQFQKQVDFLHQLRLVGFIRQDLLIERFECHKLPDQLVHGQVNLTKRTTTQHLANSVEGDLGHRWDTFEFEGFMDELHNVSYLLRTGTQRVEIFDALLKSFLGFKNLAVECPFVDIRGNFPDCILIILSDQPLTFLLHLARKVLQRSDEGLFGLQRLVRTRLLCAWALAVTS